MNTTATRPFATKDGRTGVIRPAHAGDAKPCVAIVLEAARMSPPTILTTPEEVWKPRVWRRRMLNLGEGGITLVAEVAGEVAGLLGLARGERVATRHSAEVGITVKERFRGLGAGRALMVAAEQWCRSHDVERIGLGVYDGNEAARTLYASLGYEVEGIGRGNAKFPGGYTDIVHMAKWLR